MPRETPFTILLVRGERRAVNGGKGGINGCAVVSLSLITARLEEKAIRELLYVHAKKHMYKNTCRGLCVLCVCVTPRTTPIQIENRQVQPV